MYLQCTERTDAVLIVAGYYTCQEDIENGNSKRPCYLLDCNIMFKYGRGSNFQFAKRRKSGVAKTEKLSNVFLYHEL